MENYSAMQLVCVLFLAFLLMMCLAQFFVHSLGQVLDPQSRTALLLTSVIQNIVAFAAPAVFISYMVSRRPMRWLGIDVAAPGGSYLGMILLFALAMPALNQIIFWNENMQLPASMADFETTIRKMEDTAADYSAILLSGTGIGSLLSGILVVGIITGICEELFFRAGLQRILSRSMSVHAAVWVSALVFSLVHFQFYGFVPRVILGAFFGYLYAYTGSLWLNATAHALNNSLVVVTAWIANRSGEAIASEEWGVVADGFPWPTLLSVVAVIAVLFIFKKYFYPLPPRYGQEKHRS